MSPRYPLDRRLGGTQSPSGLCGEGTDLSTLLEIPDSSIFQSSDPVFRNQWDASHWWDLTVGWVGREILRIIINSVTQNSPTQKLFLHSKLKLVIVLHHNSIPINMTNSEGFLFWDKNAA
jgi:hypothetical protein